MMPAENLRRLHARVCTSLGSLPDSPAVRSLLSRLDKIAERLDKLDKRSRPAISSGVTYGGTYRK